VRIRAHYLDGTTQDAVIGSREQVQLERKFDINFATAFDVKSGRVEMVYYLAWCGLRNAGQDVPEDFDAFLALLRDAEPLADDDAVRPTRRARRPAGSSS
jgi:hypothetical protein